MNNKPMVREIAQCAECGEDFARVARHKAKSQRCELCRNGAPVAAPDEATIYGVLCPELRAKRPERVRKPEPTVELEPLDLSTGRRGSTVDKD